MPKPKITLSEKLAKKIKLEEKRRIRKEKREQEKKVSANSVTAVTNTQKKNAPRFSSVKNLPSTKNEDCCLFTLTNDSLNHFLSFLSARDLAALVLTCRQCQHLLVKDDARAFYVLSRLSYKSSTGCFNLNLCYNIDDARTIVEQSYSGGDTGRLKIKGKAGKWKSEFVTYARFLESVNAPFVNGRFVSTSPEHTLCRAGGGDNSGPGGSGVVSSGVGKRGALGNGKRNDERKLKLITGGFGFRIRIVQVAAGYVSYIVCIVYCIAVSYIVLTYCIQYIV